jgi:prolactin regulatory element-binding protein
VEGTLPSYSSVLIVRMTHIFLTSVDDQGKIITWNTTTWKRIGSKRVVKDPISAFNISPDGKLLAV